MTPIHRLHDGDTNTTIKRFEIGRIIFYFRGPVGTNDEACFAFTFRTSDTNDVNTLFQCHVFRCNIPEAVKRVSGMYDQIFEMTNKCTDIVI